MIKKKEMKELVVAFDRSVLETIDKIARTMVDEVEMQYLAEEKAWLVNFVDPAHVCMGEIRFYKFEIVSGEPVGIGLDLDKLHNMLERVSDKNLLLEYWYEADRTGDDRKGIVKLSNEEGTLVKKMRVEEVHHSKPPAIRLRVRAVVTTAKFRKAMKFTEPISDHIGIVCESGNGLVALFAGDAENADSLMSDFDYAEFCLTAAYSIKPKEGEAVAPRYRSLFPRDYLDNLVKHIDPAVFSDVEILIDNDKPICLQFVSPDKIKVEMYLAPRIEDD
jgi:hypothetical protein